MIADIFRDIKTTNIWANMAPIFAFKMAEKMAAEISNYAYGEKSASEG